MLVNDEGRPYDARYYTSCEKGEPNFIPGRWMLEKAAEQAGLTLEDCIRFPVDDPNKRERESAMEVFEMALRNWKRPAALKAATDLTVLKRQKRPKYGGRKKQTGQSGEPKP